MAFEKSQYDVVLVNPPAGVVRERWDTPPFPHIGLAYIGNYLARKSGFVPAIVDGKLGRMTPQEVCDEVVRLRPKIVGLTAMTHMMVDAARLAESIRAKLPDCRFVLGGFHASFLPERTLNEFPIFDFLVVGEGEMAFNDLVVALFAGADYSKIPGIAFRKESGAPQVNGRGLVGATLDEFGEPGWHLFDSEVMRRHCTSLGLMTMRGCPFSCNFCSRPYGQKVRRRTPAFVVNEIADGVKNFGVRHFYFHDETFTVNKQHTVDICNGIIARGLDSQISWNATMHANTADLEMMKLIKQAGCEFLTFGVESGNDDIMVAMKKNVTKDRILRAANLCHEVGIKFHANFILGHPNETFWTALDSLKFMVRLNAMESPIGVMVPYPGTEIWDLAVESKGGYKNFSYDWEAFGKQGGKAVELETMPNWLLHAMALGGYISLYLFNFRFRELFGMAWKERRLVYQMVKQIVHGMFGSKSPGVALPVSAASGR